jgi:hypothetical protein
MIGTNNPGTQTGLVRFCPAVLRRLACLLVCLFAFAPPATGDGPPPVCHGQQEPHDLATLAAPEAVRLAAAPSSASCSTPTPTPTTARPCTTA